MSDRRPISDRYHPSYCFIVAAIGIVLGIVDLIFLDSRWWHYVYAAPWVIGCQIVQLVRDRRDTEWWYEIMTSPPYHWTIKQYFAQRWPSWLALLAVPFVGIVPIGTLYFLMGVIFYPWQRSLYFRSNSGVRRPCDGAALDRAKTRRIGRHSRGSLCGSDGRREFHDVSQSVVGAID